MANLFEQRSDNPCVFQGFERSNLIDERRDICRLFWAARYCCDARGCKSVLILQGELFFSKYGGRCFEYMLPMWFDAMIAQFRAWAKTSVFANFLLLFSARKIDGTGSKFERRVFRKFFLILADKFFNCCSCVR